MQGGQLGGAAAQSFFNLLARRDIGEHHQHANKTAVCKLWTAADLHGDALAVFAHQLYLVAVGLAQPPALIGRLDDGMLVGWYGIRPMLADQIFGGAAEHVAHGRVDKGPIAVCVAYSHPFVHILNDAFVEFLELEQLVLHALALGDIGKYFQRAGKLVGHKARRAAGQHRDARAIFAQHRNLIAVRNALPAPFVSRLRHVPLVGWDEHRPMFADQLFGLVAEHLRGGGVDEVKGFVLVGDGDAVKNILDNIFVEALQPAHFFFGLLAGSAHVRFLQLTLNSGGQAHQIILHQVIMRAGFHGDDRHVFANRARDQDKG